jgi:uncharacterized protein
MTEPLERERRAFNTAFHIATSPEGRASGGSGRSVSGYAAVFSSLSEDLGGYIEVCAPGAFTAVLKSASLDCAALINHNPDLVLGRTRAGTLKLAQDAKGLAYSFGLSDATYAHDLGIALSRGDVYQSSFSFTIGKQTWKKVDGLTVRQIDVVDELYDVSPVTFPAYRGTSVGLRMALDGRTVADFRRQLDAAPAIPEPVGWRVAALKRKLQLAEAGSKYHL